MSGRVWSTASWSEIIEPLRGHDGQVLAVALRPVGGDGSPTGEHRPDGTACGAFERGRPYTTLVRAHRLCQRRRASGPGGCIVTASSDGTARTWQAEGGRARILRGHRGPVRKAAFAADGTRRDRRRGRDGPDLGPGDEHRSRARISVRRRPSLPRRRARSPDGTTSARADGAASSACGPPSGEKALEGHKDAGEQRRVQPRRPAARQRGTRPRRDRLGRRRRAPRSYRIDEAQSATVGDARFSPDGAGSSPPGRSPRASVDGGRASRCAYLYGPTSPLVAVAFEPGCAGDRLARARRGVRRWACELCGDLESLESLAESRLRATRRTITADERARYFR